VATGDWIKYDIIDAPTQSRLTLAATLATCGHAGIGAFAASRAARKSQSALQVVLAFALGFLGGTMELLRIMALGQHSPTPR
jgi:hypothetical protein